LPEFSRRDLSRPLGRSVNGGGDAAPIFEQTPFVLRLEAHIGETGEMQHPPEAVVSVREVVTGDDGAQGRIETAKNHVKPFGEDIRIITDQANLR
jgi:hypothetical protein